MANENHDPQNGQFTSGDGGFSVNPKTGPTPAQKVVAAAMMFGTGSPQHQKAAAAAIKEVRKLHR